MYGKILIQFELVVKTGMHIGGSSTFSAIGAVDSPVIRDPMTQLPIIPGSSLKGKLRTLLARSFSGDIEKMPDFALDDEKILRLFGTAGRKGENACPPRCARLQFADCFVKNAEQMKEVGITEVKWENSIDRRTSVANPRQIERVVPGTVFKGMIVYEAVNQDEIADDMQLLARGMKLLQWDYLGGHGSRGSGRIKLQNFAVSSFDNQIETDAWTAFFEKVSSDELFSV